MSTWRRRRGALSHEKLMNWIAHHAAINLGASHDSLGNHNRHSRLMRMRRAADRAS